MLKKLQVLPALLAVPALPWTVHAVQTMNCGNSMTGVLFLVRPVVCTRTCRRWGATSFAGVEPSLREVDGCSPSKEAVRSRTRPHPRFIHAVIWPSDDPLAGDHDSVKPSSHPAALELGLLEYSPPK